MMRGDVKAIAHIQAMGGGPIGTDTGIQMDRFTIQPLSLRGDPPHQRIGMSATACFREGGYVVDIEVVSPSSRPRPTESDHRWSRVRVIIEDTRQSIASGPKLGVDERDQCLDRLPAWSKRKHRRCGALRLTRRDFRYPCHTGRQ